jgi:hypothetical protein
MKKILSLIFCICSLITMTERSARACSVFTASGIDKIYAATNKDWNNENTRIRFYAPSEGKYGRVYFGYQVSEGFQNVGGMNEHGLWYDGASLPFRSDIDNHFNKPRVKGELCEKALEECTTVEEVILLYKEFYTPHWQGHSMWADRLGNSVIIEYGERDVVFLRKEHSNQVMTNFYLSDSTNLRWANCHRFKAIREILNAKEELSRELMTSALNASHKEGLTPTLYSNVYDLINGDIYVYHFHYYGEFVRFNLAEELEKGDQYLELPGLFYGIKTKSPRSDELIVGSDICFKWSGGAAEYELRYSEDQEFNKYNFEKISNPVPGEARRLSYAPAGIILFMAWSIRKRRRWSLLVLCVLVLLGSCSSCKKLFISPQWPESMEFSACVKGLNPGTTYHWKVVSLADNRMSSESIPQTFTTSE